MSGHNYIGASGVRKIKAWVKALVPTKLSQLTNDPGYITSAGVTGVKGSAESSYRTGNVNITAANVGAAAASHAHSASDITTGTLDAARLPGVPVYRVAAAWSGNQAAFISALPSRPCVAVSSDNYEIAFDATASTDSY